ncbi:ABC-type nitrate/sulfonate/bicarbonate transport system, permease component [Actinopolyspora mzabensis]|uniref:ABC-type nitrate/sulfonate/bicarbonate transport system, permease component n=1 Tax=Actinopolyspora mzabensis TaxID=995066 RepID=A0A1G9C4B7_ACTMZ|nr:ABC transporter permease [Actinopolyspora mzabensis]SDK46508.1 ABC-type nitrate/sulfonate/bicarbonate transport system, permease component [Actinopolyspora mzabensis]
MSTEGTRVRARGRLTGAALQLTVLIVCVLLWQLITVGGDNTFFPTPFQIVTRTWELWFSGGIGTLFLTEAAFDDVLPSIGRLLLGWLIAGVGGVALGLALGRSRNALAYVGPLLSFARSIPPPALLPVFMVLFSIGFKMQLATIVFGCVWPILLNSADGARSVDVTKTETARAFRISRPLWFGSVVLPSAVPKIFAGLRISLSLALIMMVISELVGASDGLGHAMVLARDQLDYEQLWGGIVLIGVLGYVLNAILSAVESRVLKAVPQ